MADERSVTPGPRANFSDCALQGLAAELRSLHLIMPRVHNILADLRSGGSEFFAESSVVSPNSAGLRCIPDPENVFDVRCARGGVVNIRQPLRHLICRSTTRELRAGVSGREPCCECKRSDTGDMQVAAIAQTSYNSDVYAPSDDSFALVDALLDEAPLWSQQEPQVVLEIGSGSGYAVCSIALMLGQMHIRSHIIATDVSPAALTATAATLTAHGVRHVVDLVQDDLLAALDGRLQRGVDLLLFNPPYVVTPDDEVTIRGIAAAWAGGKDGRVVIDRFLAQLDALLSETGVSYMIAIQQNRPEQIVQQVQQGGLLSARIVSTRRADEELISVLAFTRASQR